MVSKRAFSSGTVYKSSKFWVNNVIGNIFADSSMEIPVPTKNVISWDHKKYPLNFLQIHYILDNFDSYYLLSEICD